MQAYRRWTILTLLLCIVPLLLIAGFVYYIDPLWTFSHSHRFNKIQMGFDERQQKTNLVAFSDFHYDGILIGSSRTTYINHEDFGDLKIFNYSVSNILLDEFDDYINYAKERNGKDFDYIILGLDFYTTNRNLTFREFSEPSYYIKKSREPFYRYKALLSSDALKFAWQDFQASRQGIPGNFTYDRHNIKTLNYVGDEEETMKKINDTVEKYNNDLYANYEYNNVKEKLLKIRRDNPRSRFIVFTTPVSQPLFALVAKDNLYPYYEQWLRDCVGVFGTVYNFMYPNTITTDWHNFYDGSHVYPSIGRLIAHRVTGCPDSSIPADFGIEVNQGNIESHLKYVREKAGVGL